MGAPEPTGQRRPHALTATQERSRPRVALVVRRAPRWLTIRRAAPRPRRSEAFRGPCGPRAMGLTSYVLNVILPAVVEVEVTDEFRAWYEGLDDDHSDNVYEAVEMLRDQGVKLRFPYCSAIAGSKYGLREHPVQGTPAARVLRLRSPSASRTPHRRGQEGGPAVLRNARPTGRTPVGAVPR